jgi:hypothetical protein
MSEEERRKKVLETRQQHARLAKIVTGGTGYFESVTVRFKGEDQPFIEKQVNVYALSSADLEAAFNAAGPEVTPNSDLKNISIAANMRFAQCIAARSTRQSDINERLYPNEEQKIMNKAFEISGLVAEPGTPKADSVSL